MKKLGNLIAGLLLTQALAPARAQFNGPSPSSPAPIYCVQGPGDVQPYVAWGSVFRAYSMATCGMPAINVCDSTGGVDVACADMVTSTTTGFLVPKVIGGLTCGTDSSGNCTIKIIYDIPGAGAHNAVQNMIADRYGLYNGVVSGCNQLAVNCGFTATSGAGYTLTASLSLTQPFALMVIAVTNNFAGTNTFLSVGNANIHTISSSAGNILATCDSSNSTATNTYQAGFAPAYLADHILTCISGSGSHLQNAFPGANAQSGGSTSVSGTPTLMANGGSATNFFEFGITTANLIADVNPSFWTPYAMHANACLAYGYTCYFSGMGDVVPFSAAWGLRAYNASATASIGGQKLIKACSADNTECSDILSKVRSGGALNMSVGGTGAGIGNYACQTAILATGSTYNSTTGAVSIAVDPTNPPFDGLSTGLVSGDNFALSLLSGTGSFASLNGAWQATSGTSSSAVNFTGSTGLTLTITGGYVSTCTIETFYDIGPRTFCGGPCDLTQATVGNRAVWVTYCGYSPYPLFYPYSCAEFVAGQSQSYTGPGTVATATPYSMMFVAQRTGNTSNYNTVLSCVPCSAGFANSANNVYAQDGLNLVTGAANDNFFHSVVGESDGTNLRIYVDGTLATTGSSAGLSMTQPFGIGNKIGSSFYFQGQFLEGGVVNSNIATSAAPLAAQQQLFFGYVP
jgi:hypothetical protein